MNLAARIGTIVALFGIASVPVAFAQTPVWEDVVKAAEAEGEVAVRGAPGRNYEEALATAFRRAYPKIKLNFTGTAGRDTIPQMLREREAGVYTWDVFVGGASSVLPTLKPAGALAPLRPALILPEVLDDKAWINGFDAGWMDNEKKFNFGFDLSWDPMFTVNWDLVKRDDLKTYDDLLKPQFARKIVATDPRVSGEGSVSAAVLALNFGDDFLKRLFGAQQVTFTTNRRQNAEWVVRGRYPIGFATGAEEIENFQREGLGKNISIFRANMPKPVGSSGFGTISLMDKAPHPNAAKVYINWLLSRAGQAEWKHTQRNSRRTDVPPVRQDLVPPAGADNIQKEEYLALRENASKLAREVIPATAP
jgi:iron(III) transport system substrate-binding protein